MTTPTPLSIRCGHCKHTHPSVEDVRECVDTYRRPEEICCNSCDASKGYATTPAEARLIASRRCTCDSDDAYYWSVMEDEERAAQYSFA